ncbi:MAG: glycosyl hydrolase [Meiothermus sp.]|nr:glycosyl hydrolase [Meiothermus sp.]
MRLRLWILVVIVCLGLVPAQPKPLTLMPPAAGQLYHGVYPGTDSGNEDDMQPSDLEAYEAAVGRRAAVVYFSNNWYNGRGFPAETAAWIRARGAVPYVRLMLRSDSEINRPEPLYTLEAILRGDFDADLRAWGQTARAFGTPVMVEWGTEMNGRWFSWNGVWNGGAGKGPEKFRQAYRKLVGIMNTQGATNLIWVWHVNAGDDPDAAWNRLENYYPGGDVVDWLAVSVYGGQTPRDPNWPPFAERMDEVIPRLSKLAPTKPVLVAEFGATAGNPRGTPDAWANAALTALLSNRWPSVRGFSWWNEAWPNDNNPAHNTEMRVQKIPALAAVFRKQLASSKVLERPLFK